jgi:hypothetical protein
MKSADVCNVSAQQNWEMLLHFPVFTFDKFPEKKSGDAFVMWTLLAAVFASDHRSSSISSIVMVNVYSTFI